VPNYPILVIDPHILSDEQLALLDTSLREVFTCIKASRDRKTLKEIVNSSPRFQHMDSDAVNLIKAALDIDIQINSNQKEINMCQAIEEWKKELLDEGEKLGIEKGEKLGIEKGEKLGIEKGEKLGIEKGKFQIAKNMLHAGHFSLQQIATLTELPIQTVQQLACLS
jgi:predicted transposase/invertase (TIGR01784 family)